MLHGKVIFSKTLIFWPEEIYLRHLKGFQAYFIDKGYVLDIYIPYQLSKVNLAKLVAFLWFTLNFVKKLSQFWKKLQWPGKGLELVRYSFFSSHLYPKRNKKLNCFKNEKFRPHEFFWISGKYSCTCANKYRGNQ